MKKDYPTLFDVLRTAVILFVVTALFEHSGIYVVNGFVTVLIIVVANIICLLIGEYMTQTFRELKEVIEYIKRINR